MGRREYTLLMRAERALNARCGAIFDPSAETPRDCSARMGWSKEEIRRLSVELWTLAARLEHLELEEPCQES